MRNSMNLIIFFETLVFLLKMFEQMSIIGVLAKIIEKFAVKND